jgi:peptidase M28-like protein
LFEPLLTAVRGEVSGERAHESVRAIARHHRVQSSPGYDEAAAWLAARLESYGLAVERETVPADGRTRFMGWLMPQGWACARATALLVSGGARERLCDYDAEKLSLVLRSAPARGRFPVVAPEETPDAAVRGAVVLTRSAVHAAHRRFVVEGGAAGLLSDGRRLVPPVRDAFEDPDALSYTSFWWNESEPRGWGFVLSPRAGARLRERLRAGEALELEVEIESRAFDTQIPLVSAVIPAAGGGGSEIVILSHLCHPQPSANDNASGAAANLEAARTLAALAARGAWRPGARAVRFLWMPEITGTCAWLAQDPRRGAQVAAALNLDMVGEDQEQCGSTLLVERPPCFQGSFAEELLLRIRRAATDWVPSYSGPGHFSMTRSAEVPYAAGSDHAVLVNAGGVPCPMLIQWPDRFYHSSHDTPDKCDPRSLALAAACAATYAGFLSAAGEREVEWLAEAVGRGARRRALDALDEEDASRAFARERMRALRALASLGRIGATEAATAAATRSFEDFARREGACVPECALPARSPGVRPARPRRSGNGPLEFLWHLLPGFDRLPPAERAAWGGIESAIPGGRTTLELAWAACDGSRTLEEIAHLVWLESGAAVKPAGAAEQPGLRELFGRLERLGMVALREEVPG